MRFFFFSSCQISSFSHDCQGHISKICIKLLSYVSLQWLPQTSRIMFKFVGVSPLHNLVPDCFIIYHLWLLIIRNYQPVNFLKVTCFSTWMWSSTCFFLFQEYSFFLDCYACFLKSIYPLRYPKYTVSPPSFFSF